MRYTDHLRSIGLALALGAGLIAATGCQSRPVVTTAPVPEATSLFVRNFTGFDVAVYAVPNATQKAVWLTNVPVGASRSISLRWSDLQANGGLVVRTQIVGSSKSWTSDPLLIDDGIIGVLDIKSDHSLATGASVLRGVTTQAFSAAMR
jgi:hypothetical protein